MSNSEACDLLLKSGSVVTVDEDRRVIEPGSVAVRGNRIVAVGPDDELNHYEPVRTIDCSGRAVIPGLIDTHNHLFQGLARGLGEGMPLWTWLTDFMWPFSTNITPDEARIGALLGAVEAARAGTTAVVDNHYAPTDLDTTLAVAGAIETVGLRGAVARGIMGEATEVARRFNLAGALFQYSNDEEIEITDAAIDAYPPGGLVGVWPAPVNVIYNDQDLVRRSVELARKRGTGWHTHCSERKEDPPTYVDEYGIRPVEWLYREGLLGPEATLAHGIYLDDDEIAHVGETETGIAYCPISHEYIGLGVMRLRDLRASNAPVGLGTDGPCCNHRQDMFECMKQAILLQRVHSLEPTVSNGEEAMELATLEGARYLGVDVGSLEPGKLADIVVVDLEQPHLTPRHRTVAALAYSARGSDVIYNIVDGRIIYENGHCTLVDERAIMEEAQRRSEELIARAGLEPLLQPWRTDLI
ncbi:MAG: amidohydrolase [Acidimicrobiia bacterium]|nr:amidohydrolase [Acidimicrobiia bacterium]